MQFQIGDLVLLKSGGPLMTVTDFNEKIECSWFDGKKKQSGWFPAEALEIGTREEDATAAQLAEALQAGRERARAAENVTTEVQWADGTVIARLDSDGNPIAQGLQSPRRQD
jgi:uncharacterized protein YodC (DUF2158 family)